MDEPAWNLLQISDVLDLELLSALSERVSVLGWEPERRWRPAAVPPGQEPERLAQVAGGDGCAPLVRVRHLPLMRGFARAPMRWVAGTGRAVTERLLRQSAAPERTPLICTVPYFAEVAERWPGPVVYWLTDLIAEYRGANRAQVVALDRRMCRAATVLCPNSQRLADYLTHEAGARTGQICIVPNATRASNILPAPPDGPMDPPAILQGLPRPFAGVVGNLAGNLDWVLLKEVVERTPWLHWVFVGPSTMPMQDRAACASRQALTEHPRTLFTGRQPYGELAGFARSFDVAVLPYRRCEPTFSGSSTRFYEHLAACRPMVATPGLHELTTKEPLLRLADSAEQMVGALEQLRSLDFRDGLEAERWRASRRNTWSSRAAAIQAAVPQSEP